MTRLLLIICTILLLSGCGRAPWDPRPSTGITSSLDQRLSQRVIQYRSILPTVQDEHGFIDSDHCDSLLFTGLLAASGIPIDLVAARDGQGQWFRTPAKTCYAEGRSRSTISRDMLLGVYWWAYRTNQLPVLEDLWEYGVSHAWVMGDGRLAGADTVMNGNMIKLLAELIHTLGGENHPVGRAIPLTWTSDETGFRAHLQVLQILLATELGLTDTEEYDIIKGHTTRQPNNPLFRVAAGEYEAAAQLLLNTRWWPAGRLPTSADRCEGWLPMRDEGSDWSPCHEDRVHSGADLLFTAHFITRG